MLLSSDLWVGALLRRVEQAGAFGYVARKGDARAGSVLIKLVNLRTREASVLREAQTGAGEAANDTVWMRPVETVNEPDIDAWLQRQVRFDPDLWIIEIEDVEGRHFLTEKVDLG